MILICVYLKMEKSKLILYMKSFDEADWRNFLQLIVSPYFNTNTRVTMLGEYLSTCAPAFAPTDLDKGKLFAIIYPEKGKRFSEQVIHDHFSLLLRQVEQYFIQDRLIKQSQREKVILGEALVERGLGKGFQRLRRSFQSEVSAMGATSLPALYDGFQFSLLQLRESQRVRDKRTNNRLLESIQALDTYYLVHRLKLGVEELTRTKVFQQEGIVAPKRSMLEAGLQTHEAEEPLWSIYSQIFHLYQNPQNTTLYDSLLGTLESTQDLLSHSEALEVYVCVLNYCTRKFNEGDTSFLPRLFSLYQTMLDRSLVLQNDGTIPHTILKNIVTVGLRNKAYDWTHAFIESYSSKIKPELQSDVYAYNLAMYHFETHKFREALKGLATTKFKDPFYELGARTLQVKIYYEMEEDDSISYLVKAFRAALKRNKTVSQAYYTPFNAFLRVVEKMYRLKLKKITLNDTVWQAQFTKLQEMIDGQGAGIADASWIREKMLLLAAM